MIFVAAKPPQQESFLFILLPPLGAVFGDFPAPALTRPNFREGGERSSQV
jgi:hypothetical protein